MKEIIFSSEYIDSDNFQKYLDKLESEAWANMLKEAPNEKFRREYKARSLGLKFKGLTDNQKRDFDYYLLNGRKEKCHSNFWKATPQIIYQAKSIEEWYWLWDTHGLEVISPSHRDTESIKQIKEFTNLTIKMWVEGVCEFTCFIPEIKEACEKMPAWVYKAFSNQLKKSFIESQGFVPAFVINQL